MAFLLLSELYWYHFSNPITSLLWPVSTLEKNEQTITEKIQRFSGSRFHTLKTRRGILFDSVKIVQWECLLFFLYNPSSFIDKRERRKRLFFLWHLWNCFSFSCLRLDIRENWRKGKCFSPYLLLYGSEKRVCLVVECVLSLSANAVENLTVLNSYSSSSQFHPTPFQNYSRDKMDVLMLIVNWRAETFFSREKVDLFSVHCLHYSVKLGRVLRWVPQVFIMMGKGNKVAYFSVVAVVVLFSSSVLMTMTMSSS